LYVWDVDAPERSQHVRGLLAVASGHHRGFAEAGDGVVLPGVRALLAAPEDVGEGGAGVEGTAHILREEVEEFKQSAPHGCGVYMDGAALEAVEGEAEDPEGGYEWCNS
jgi:hypothetical protein